MSLFRRGNSQVFFCPFAAESANVFFLSFSHADAKKDTCSTQVCHKDKGTSLTRQIRLTRPTKNGIRLNPEIKSEARILHKVS